MNVEKAAGHTSALSRADGDASGDTAGMQDWHLQGSTKHLTRRREGTVITSRLGVLGNGSRTFLA